DVEARYTLPPQLEFVNPADAETKFIAPNPLPAGETGVATWRVRVKRLSFNDRTIEHNWVVTGSDEKSRALDEAYTKCVTIAPGITPYLECSLAMPDSLQPVFETGGVAPNPFTVTGTITNIGLAAKSVGTVELNLDPSQFVFDSATPRFQSLSETIAPGSSIDIQWIVTAQYSNTSRTHMAVMQVVDDESTLFACESNLFVSEFPNDLSCDLAVDAEIVSFDKDLQKYVPETWEVVADLRNASGELKSSVDVTLVLQDPKGLVELDAVTPNNTLVRNFQDWLPGETRQVRWTLRTVGILNITAPEDIRYSIGYSAGGADFVPAGCEVDQTILPNSSREPNLECDVLMPDTIRFVDSAYVPGNIVIGVRLRNTGTGDARNVNVSMLQDQRFTVLHTPSFTIPHIGAQAIQEVPAFRVRLVPRQASGWDTVKIIAYTDDGAYTSCEYPVFIEAVKIPDLTVICDTEIDSIFYNSSTGEFEPSEFSVSMNFSNSGEIMTKEISATLPANRYFEIADGSAVRTLPDLAPGESGSLVWHLRPRCTNDTGRQRLPFEVFYRGGLGAQLYTTGCEREIYIEPCTGAGIEALCEAPVKITVDETSGATVFTARVVNNSNDALDDMSLFIQQGQWFQLQQGEPTEKQVGTVAPGDTGTASWFVIPRMVQDSTVAAICVRVLQSGNEVQSCCSDVLLIPGQLGELALFCSSIDTLRLDSTPGLYENAPFDACFHVENRGSITAEGLYAELEYSGIKKSVVPVLPIPVLPIPPGGRSTWQCWKVLPPVARLPRHDTLTISLYKDSVLIATCTKIIYAEGSGTLNVVCDVSLDGGDTVQTVRGTIQRTISVEFTNLESTALTGGTATLSRISPELVTLIDSPTRPLPADPFLPGESVTVTWTVEIPELFRERNLIVEAYSAFDSGAAPGCNRWLSLLGITPEIDIAVPQDNFARFGRRARIPVMVTGADTVGFSNVKFTLGYDEDLMRFDGISTAGTLMELGWDPPVVQDLPGGAAYVQSTLRTTPARLSTSVPLLYLEFTINDDPRRHDPVFVESTLPFLCESAECAFEASVDGLRMDAAVGTSDGTLYITGDCIIPLTAAEGITSLSNTPNPFADRTMITFTLTGEAHVTLAVQDMFGREVCAIDAGWRDAGEHAVEFDAGGLPGGMYIVILSTEKSVVAKKMLLDR
ncbi:MAG: hypothetical protein CL946_12620, partial [Ectothiorhodospiraceae bacterium]|nr:hypothetical protein [Ectothiorhodospiraceae bacterium]